MEYKDIFTLGLNKLFEKKEKGLPIKAFANENGTTPSASMSTYYDLYRKNLDVQRAVEELQQAFFSSGFEVYRNDEFIESVEIESLLYYGQDNGKYKPSKTNFIKLKNKIIRDIVLTGNCFIEKIKNKQGRIVGYKVLDPRTFRIVADKFGNPVRYLQKGGFGSDYVEFQTDEIYHYVHKEDPNNPIWGLSVLGTIIADVYSDLEAAQMNYAFFKNNATPSTMIMLDNNLEPEEIEIAMEQLKAQFAGGKNKHRTVANYGIKDVKSFSPTHKDMDFLNQRVFTSKVVARAFGVPPMMLGMTEELNYANADQQYERYIEDTIRPLERVGEMILTDLIGIPELEIRAVDNHLNTLEKKADLCEKLRGTLKTNEIREILGYDPDEDGDNILVQNNLIRLQDAILIPENQVAEPTPNQ